MRSFLSSSLQALENAPAFLLVTPLATARSQETVQVCQCFCFITIYFFPSSLPRSNFPWVFLPSFCPILLQTCSPPLPPSLPPPSLGGPHTARRSSSSFSHDFRDTKRIRGKAPFSLPPSLSPSLLPRFDFFAFESTSSSISREHLPSLPPSLPPALPPSLPPSLL